MITSSKIRAAPWRVGQGAQALEEAGQGQDGADVVRDRLGDHGGDLLGVGVERRFHRRQVVEGQDDRVLDRLGQHARPTRGPCCPGARPG